MIQRHSARRVPLQLDFLDSTGLKALVEAHAGPNGHRVSFVRGNSMIEQVLQVSHLDGELRFRAP